MLKNYRRKVLTQIVPSECSCPESDTKCKHRILLGSKVTENLLTKRARSVTVKKVRDGMKQCQVNKDVTKKNHQLSLKIAILIRMSSSALSSILKLSANILKGDDSVRKEALENTLKELRVKMANVHEYVNMLFGKALSKEDVAKFAKNQTELPKKRKLEPTRELPKRRYLDNEQRSIAELKLIAKALNEVEILAEANIVIRRHYRDAVQYGYFPEVERDLERESMKTSNQKQIEHEIGISPNLDRTVYIAI